MVGHMPHSSILTQEQVRVRVFGLNRPLKLNAWICTMLDEIVDQVAEWNNDSSIEPILINSQGGSS